MTAPADFTAPRLPNLPRKPFVPDAVRNRAERAVTFTAWCVPDDGQKRTKGFGVKLPIEGPRYPAPGLSERFGNGCTGRPVDAPGYWIDVAGTETLREALDQAKTCCGHKSHLIIAETDSARGKTRLHVYAIKQDSCAKYRGPFNTERYHELYEFHLFDLDVPEFAVCPPADAARDPVGRDLSLVSR